MLKLKKSTQIDVDPLKDKNGHNIFNVEKNGEFGFILKPRCFSYNDILNILAIGNSKGIIKIIGSSDVEFQAEHDSCGVVQQILFMKGKNELVTIFEANGLYTLYLWHFSKDSYSKFFIARKFYLERIAKVSFCCVSNDSYFIYIGNEHGNVFLFNLKSFALEENIIYHDLIYQSLPLRNDNKRKDLGSVEIIINIEKHLDKVLIGYRCGLVVIWNLHKTCIDYCLDFNQDLEYVYWNNETGQVVSSYILGTICHWTLDNTLSLSNMKKKYIHNDPSTTGQPIKVIPYKSEICKPITKIEWHHPFFIFTGGTPINMLSDISSDENSISFMQGSFIIAVVEFGSNVIDFITCKKNCLLNCLVVLTEQEIIYVDISPLYNKGFKPYLLKEIYPECSPCIHSSSITTMYLINNCPPDIHKILLEISKKFISSRFTDKPWPFTGETSSDNQKLINKVTILLTGHEDGSVIFWNIMSSSNSSMKMLFKISTSTMYDEYQNNFETSTNKIRLGLFDPFIDDIRFSIQKIHLCVLAKKIFIAGCVGNLIILNLLDEDKNITESYKEFKIELIPKSNSYVWKGHEPLNVTNSIDKISIPFNVDSVFTVYPPTPFTSLTFDYIWGLVAFGTCHGFGIIDLFCMKTILTFITYDMTKSSDNSTIQRKSFARSLRESFRKLRIKKTNNEIMCNFKNDDVNENRTNSRSNSKFIGGSRRKFPNFKEANETFKRPAAVNRLVNENYVDESLMGTIRCLTFINSSIEEGSSRCPCLWTGTNSGMVYISILDLPTADKRLKGEPVKVVQCREIQLKHKAPVISIIGIDRAGAPLPINCSSIFNWTKEKKSNYWNKEKLKNVNSIYHHVIICSEEQLRIVQMPGIKLKLKEKLTAVDGSRIRKAIHLPLKINQDYSNYNYLVLTTNYGFVSIHNPITLKSIKKDKIIDKDDILALQSIYLSDSGCGLFLKSSCSLQRFSILASQNCKDKINFTFSNGNSIEKS